MQSNRRLEGAKFVLLDCHRREIMCCKTNCNGEAVMGCLPYGKYFLVEVEAPCGYLRNDREIEIIINDSCPHRCLEVFNERATGSIKITKLSC